nr:MAG: phosphoprotein [Tolviot virus]
MYCLLFGASLMLSMSTSMIFWKNWKKIDVPIIMPSKDDTINCAELITLFFGDILNYEFSKFKLGLITAFGLIFVFYLLFFFIKFLYDLMIIRNNYLEKQGIINRKREHSIIETRVSTNKVHYIPSTIR